MVLAVIAILLPEHTWPDIKAKTLVYCIGLTMFYLKVTADTHFSKFRKNPR